MSADVPASLVPLLCIRSSMRTSRVASPGDTCAQLCCGTLEDRACVSLRHSRETAQDWVNFCARPVQIRQPSKPASNVLDGDSSTFWHTSYSNPAMPHTLTIWFGGATVAVSGLTYLPRQDSIANGRIGSYEILFSADGDSFDAASASSGTWPDSSALKTVTFATVEAKALRIVSKREAGGRCSCTCAAVIKVCGTEVAPPPRSAQGSWGPLIKHPLVPVASALLPSGDVRSCAAIVRLCGTTHRPGTYNLRAILARIDARRISRRMILLRLLRACVRLAQPGTCSLVKCCLDFPGLRAGGVMVCLTGGQRRRQDRADRDRDVQPRDGQREPQAGHQHQPRHVLPRHLYARLVRAPVQPPYSLPLLTAAAWLCCAIWLVRGRRRYSLHERAQDRPHETQDRTHAGARFW